jgi:hypothetical protein
MSDPVSPAPGTVLRLTDDQYRFGVGPLLCRVQQVIGLVHIDDAPWWHLRGQCANGTAAHHGPWSGRELYVISSAVTTPQPRRGLPS